jgi:hypothetical protein
MTRSKRGKEIIVAERLEPFQFTFADFHDDGADAISEGAAVRLLFPLEDRAPDAGVDDAIWVDCAWTRRERETVRDAGVRCTEGREGQGGKRFGAFSTRTDPGRDGWVGSVGHHQS